MAHKSNGYNEVFEVKKSDNTISNSLQHLFKFQLDEQEYASLSANIQLSRDSRKSNNKVFVKIQLINDSTPFKKDAEGKRYYSVATEKVNNKAFFGVKIGSKVKILFLIQITHILKMKIIYLMKIQLQSLYINSLMIMPLVMVVL